MYRDDFEQMLIKTFLKNILWKIIFNKKTKGAIVYELRGFREKKNLIGGGGEGNSFSIQITFMRFHAIVTRASFSFEDNLILNEI